MVAPMRSRLIALLVVPTLTILVLATMVVGTGDERYREAEQHRNLAILADLLASLDGDLGEEALASALLVSSGEANTTEASDTLVGPRFQTDLSLRLVQRHMLALESHAQAISSAVDNAREMTWYRTDVESGQISARQVADRYSFIRRQLLDALSRETIAEGVDGGTIPELINLINLRSAHLDERLVVQLAIRSDKWAPGQHALVVSALSEQELYLRSVPLAVADRLEPRHALSSLRNRMELTDEVPSIPETRWVSLSDQWLAPLNREITRSTNSIVDDLTTVADQAADNRRRTIALVSSSLILGLLLVFFVSVRLVRRLLRITGIAEMVTVDGGYADEAGVVTINDDSRDEIGRLSRAFDTMTTRVQDAAIRQRGESHVLEMIVRGEPIDDILDAAARLLGVTSADKPKYRFIPGDAVDNEPHQPSRLRIVNARGGRVVESLPESAGVAVGLAAMAQRRAADDAELAEKASRDVLTGLFNRRSVLEYAEQLIDRADSAGAPVGGALLYIDLDGFKAINDEYGHGAGDIALMMQAANMERFARYAGGAAGRIGGDEFLVVLDQVITEADLAEKAAELARLLIVPLKLDDTLNVICGSSVGAALMRAGIDLDQVLHEADTALYSAKVAGESLAVISTEQFRREVREQESLAEAFLHALERNEFCLWYQPIWSRGGVELVGLEALARWERPDVGLVFPDVFLPVAESLNLMAELDANLFERVCEQMAAWEKQGYDVPPINVNVAPPRLESDGFVASTLDTLAAHGCAPASIILEVTEQLFMQQMETNCARLAELRDAGVRVAVDDFGQGYSSLAYLQHLPVDVLKVDREFVSNIDTSPTKAAIVSAVNELAIAMNLVVVAEGVERQEELDRLADIGCSMVQGYLLARPMPVAKLMDLFPAPNLAGQVCAESTAWFEPEIPDGVPEYLAESISTNAQLIAAEKSEGRGSQ